MMTGTKKERGKKMINFDYYKKVIEAYPQTREHLTSDHEFYFEDPTAEEFALMHKVMKHFWLSVSYESIDFHDCYFLYNHDLRSYYQRKEEGYIHKVYEVITGYCDEFGDFVQNYEADCNEFEAHEDASDFFHGLPLKRGEIAKLVIYEWYNDDEVINLIELETREG